jgi:hypothetical protein
MSVKFLIFLMVGLLIAEGLIPLMPSLEPTRFGEPTLVAQKAYPFAMRFRKQILDQIEAMCLLSAIISAAVFCDLGPRIASLLIQWDVLVHPRPNSVYVLMSLQR